MTQRVPWSVKGITREDRELAKAAAQKAGLSVGAWLTQQIRQAAEAPSPAAAADPSAAPSSYPSPLPSAAPPRSSAPWAARAAAAAAPETPRFAFGPGRWQRAAAAVDGTSVKKARGDAVAGDEIVVTEPAAPTPAAIAAPSAGAPAGAQLSRSPTGRADWHAEVTAYQTAVDGILGELRDEVTNLRAARTRDREQIAETMVGLLRHLTDMGAALSTVEEDVTKLRQTADQLARRPVPPPAAQAPTEDSGQIHAALSTTAQAIMRLAVRLDHLETRRPPPGFWQRLFGVGGKPPPKSRRRRTTQRRARK
ncbi:MAG: hypothetical protein VYC31_10440 [Pseudomonadota bacterium]|nr:hypothetical protein [Pseudomonadota bacterium]